jgi:diguanylate cyclase (GGDEF)-like protein
VATGVAVVHNINLDVADFLLSEIAIVDAAGAITRWNRKWDETARIGLLSHRDTGWNYIAECKAAIERGCGEAMAVLEGLQAVLKGSVPYFVGTYACPFNKLHHWYQVQITTFELAGELHAVVMHVDVSALQRDPLTGLANRAMFEAQLDLAISLARDSSSRTEVILIDMDRLKLINDMFGHRVGDQALVALAAKLRKKVAPDCVVARIGGDEFGVVLAENSDSLMAPRLRTQLRAGVAYKIGPADKPALVSASVGTAYYPDDGATVSELLVAADKSMYAEKRGFSVA